MYMNSQIHKNSPKFQVQKFYETHFYSLKAMKRLSHDFTISMLRPSPGFSVYYKTITNLLVSVTSEDKENKLY